MAFVKLSPPDHPEAALVEAAGLRWLAQAADDGGAPVVSVRSASRGSGPGQQGPAQLRSTAQRGRLELEELPTAAPDERAGEEFGRALARTHGWLTRRRGDKDGGEDDGETPAAGREGFGVLPPEHPAQTPASFGPAEQPLVMGAGVHPSWGTFLAQERLDPVLSGLDSELTAEEARLLHAARDRIAAGELDDAEPPALIHGDLWSGNVLWTPTPSEPTPSESLPSGAVDSGSARSGSARSGSAHSGSVRGTLIDPAAHTGHRETDIAFLHLFGLPQLEAVLRGYQREFPLTEGWQDRIGLHQFFCLGVHWLLFGPSYRRPTLRAAEEILTL
ncbi:fructosamine kinase family protein [Nesterenkonia sp. Act20]|uniref:fructosamine kinase family protein n=1 Tax=Nesterenkonia sp. Act20 TaxID=1483432 RepID=UPI001C459062|nr:fructosamine kinase family protein [Nesterenkonia sp. Act20]